MGCQHPAARDGNLWTNHAARRNPDETDALFMIGACAAFVSYLINKARSAAFSIVRRRVGDRLRHLIDQSPDDHGFPHFDRIVRSDSCSARLTVSQRAHATGPIHRLISRSTQSRRSFGREFRSMRAHARASLRASRELFSVSQLRRATHALDMSR
jgi:hypothetical protein